MSELIAHRPAATPLVSNPGGGCKWVRRVSWLLFLSIFLPMLVTYHPARGWNVNSRLGLILAVVDQGTLRIDDYQAAPDTATGDKAVFENHFYCDKIIGVSLLGIPFYGLLRLGMKPLGLLPTTDFADWFVRVPSVSLISALGAVLLFHMIRRLGGSPRRSLVVTLVGVFGTMWFGFSTMLYPYLPGCVLCLAALALLLFPPQGRLNRRLSLGIGTLLGGALLYDMTFGLLVAALGVVLVLRLLDQCGAWGMRAFSDMVGERSTVGDAFKLLLWAAVGGFVALLPFVVYTTWIFGKPGIPYAYEAEPVFRHGMSRGIMGVTWPKLDPLLFITIHPYRGLFFWSPFLVVIAAGCAKGLRAGGRRALVSGLGLWAMVAYLLFNSGYYMWWGGWTMGPRLLIPTLPLVLLAGVEVARPGSRWIFGVFCVAGAWAVLTLFPLGLFDPQLPQGYPEPALFTAVYSDGTIEGPQFEALRLVYSGGATQAGVHALTGLQGLGSYLLPMLLALVPAAFAWRLAPPADPTWLKDDLPFATVDGSVAALGASEPPSPPQGGAG